MNNKALSKSHLRLCSLPHFILQETCCCNQIVWRATSRNRYPHFPKLVRPTQLFSWPIYRLGTPHSNLTWPCCHPRLSISLHWQTLYDWMATTLLDLSQIRFAQCTTVPFPSLRLTASARLYVPVALFAAMISQQNVSANMRVPILTFSASINWSRLVQATVSHYRLYCH